METEKYFCKKLNEMNLSANDEKLEQFNIYYTELVNYNQFVNLTSITEKEEVYEKHFLDSILPIAEFKQNATVCDIGTGAGFPSLPLGILREDLKIYAVDSLNKRIDFLNMLLNKLNLHNVKTFHFRAEDFAKDYREHFDYVVSRAVSKLNTLCEYSLPLVKVGGYMVAYKSINYIDEIDESKKAIDILGSKKKKILEFKLEKSESTRYIIFIKKIAPTPKKYPRGQNKPKLQPL